MIRFYNKFFRRQYPGALMWLVVAAVAVRFAAKASWITLRRLRGGKGAAGAAMPLPAPPLRDQKRDLPASYREQQEISGR